MALEFTVRALPDTSDGSSPACCTYESDALWVAEDEGASSTVGEAGAVQFAQQSKGAWTDVSLSQTFSDPVVVAGPPSYRGGQPVVLRVRKVKRRSFQIQLNEWNYLDERHTTEDVPWLAVEAGSHTLTDGRRIEAGHTENVGSGWTSQTFSTSFAAPPIVLVQVSSAKGKATVTPRVQNVTGSEFQVLLQREENPSESQRAETVAWIAIEADGGHGWTGSGTAGVPYHIGLTADAVTHEAHETSFEVPFTETPAVLAALQTFDGGDTASLRTTAQSGADWSVFVEEEQSGDSEVRHTTEVVGWVALAPGLLLGDGGVPQRVASRSTSSPQAGALAASVVTAGSAPPAVLTLDGVRPNPSRGSGRVRYGLPSEADVTIEVFDALGRRVGVLADGRQSAGWHEADAAVAGLPAGLYVVRLRAGAEVLAEPFTVVR